MKKLSIALGMIGFILLLWSFMPVASSTPGVATTRTSAPVASSATGKALFAAKGCATCHVNRRAIESAGECCEGVAPDLTLYTNDPAFLRRWLADPPAVRPGTQMPNLNLSDAEIEQLIAFLNEPR